MSAGGPAARPRDGRLRAVLEVAGTTAVMLAMATYGRRHLQPGVALDDAMRLVFFIGVFGWALVLEGRLRSTLSGTPLSRGARDRATRILAGRYRVGYAILLSCWALLLVAASAARS